MPPKRIQVQPARARSSKSSGYLGSAFETLTSEDNRSVVISVAMFGAAVTFLNSEWAELLLPM